MRWDPICACDRIGGTVTGFLKKHLSRLGHAIALQRAALGSGALAWVLAAGTVYAQEEVPPEPAGAPVTVSGTVLNGATGHALARALVSVAGDRTHAVLTDGDGKFSIPAVPAGHRIIEVTKPGFAQAPGNAAQSSMHAVTVATDMPSLTLNLYATNVLSGHLNLSTGAAAVGMELRLMQRQSVNGRERWSVEDVHQATPASEFRFHGKPDGTYLLATKPEFDNNLRIPSGCPADAPPFLLGYPETFYTDGHDLAGATRIPLSGGRNEDVTLSVSLVRFQLVQVMLQHPPAGGGWKYSYTLFEQDGHDAGYRVEEQPDHSVCAYLPDGNYTLFVEADRRGEEENAGSVVHLGSLSFSVEGKPRRDLRVAVGAGVSTPVHIRYEPHPPAQNHAANAGNDDKLEERDPNEAVAIVANRTGAMANEPGAAAESDARGQVQLPPAAPGSYWLDVTAQRASMCLGSATVTGQSVTRAPWTAGASGSGSPIDIVLRTDCAKLKIQLPVAALADGPGEHTIFHVYAVPRFETPEGVSETEVDSAEATIVDLTPGSYRVYITRSPAELDPRDPASLEKLGSGKDVDLAPDSETSVSLEVPEP